MIWKIDLSTFNQEVWRCYVWDTDSSLLVFTHPSGIHPAITSPVAYAVISLWLCARFLKTHPLSTPLLSPHQSFHYEALTTTVSLLFMFFWLENDYNLRQPMLRIICNFTAISSKVYYHIMMLWSTGSLSGAGAPKQTQRSLLSLVLVFKWKLFSWSAGWTAH